MPTSDRAQKQTSISQFFKPKKSCATQKYQKRPLILNQLILNQQVWQPDLPFDPPIFNTRKIPQDVSTHQKIFCSQ